MHCCFDVVAHLVIAIAARFAMMCPAQQFGHVGAKLYDGNSFLMLDLSHTSMLGCMSMRVRDFILKSIPYLLSIAGGILLFVLTQDNIADKDVSDLVTNIAASLLSIPLVFLLYDYSNSRISNKLSATLMANMTDKINVLVLNIIMLLRRSIGVRGRATLESLNRMDGLTAKSIAQKIKLTRPTIKTLRAYHIELESLLYSAVQSNLLSLNQVQTLSGLGRELLHLVNETRFRNSRTAIARHVENIVTHTTDWLDADAGRAIDFEHLLAAAQTRKTKNK